ncbi:MAG TPA: hypothetical protein VFP31_07770 [Gaiellaceae bacterium]|nr:hypothetical protein [Gaiellaceae bacterium]
MAEDLSVPRPVAARPAEPAKPRRMYARRFMFAYVLLGLAVVFSVAMFMFAFNTDSAEERAWSSWKPGGEGEARIWQIADHVGAGYRASNGELAARILAGPPTFNTTDEQGRTLRLPLEGVLVKGRASDQSDSRAVLFSGDSVMYALCGTGNACQPGAALLQVDEIGTKYEREALELALYTFKYVDGVNSVIAFLPPFPQRNAQGQVEQVRTVVYLEKSQLGFELGRPLKDTLRAKSGLDFSNIERNDIVQLVHPRLYSFSPEQAPNGAWILSLERFQA